jgi:hypothetical protein
MYEIEKRSPLNVILLTIITCGFYLIYWYYKIYQELKLYTGKTPTNNPFWLDFLINLITCGIWGIYVDYKISKQLHEIRLQNNLKGEDSSLIVLILDSFSIFTLHLLWILTSAIQQDEWNQILENVAIPIQQNTDSNTKREDFFPNPYE